MEDRDVVAAADAFSNLGKGQFGQVSSEIAGDLAGSNDSVRSVGR